MTRDEQLKFCKICKNQRFTIDQGVICRLTNKIADFEDSCNLFEEDTDLVKRLNRTYNDSASQGKRFANFILDSLFFIVFFFFLMIILFLIAPSFASILREDNKLIYYLFTMIAFFVYYSAFEALTGRTIAKYITKTKVVNGLGEKPNLKAILLRTLCRFIPFEAFSFIETGGTGWHDSFSKTKVIEI